MQYIYFFFIITIKAFPFSTDFLTLIHIATGDKLVKKEFFYPDFVTI